MGWEHMVGYCAEQLLQERRRRSGPRGVRRTYNTPRSMERGALSTIHDLFLGADAEVTDVTILHDVIFAFDAG